MTTFPDARGARPRATLGDGEPLTLANHPRAGERITRLKAWGGLAGFGLAALFSWRAGMPFPDAAARALAAGILGYLGVWALALYVWKIIVDAEHRAALAENQAAAAAESERRAAMAPPGFDAPAFGAPGGDGFGGPDFDAAGGETIDPHAAGPTGPASGLVSPGA